MLEYNKYLMKKEKRQKTKQYFNKIHKEKLRQDLNFEVDYKNRFNDTQYDPLDIEANMEKHKQLKL